MTEKTLMDFVKEAKSHIREVDADEAEQLIAQGYRVLDVREPVEYLSGAIEGALHVPRGILEAAADRKYEGANPELRDHRDDPWLVVCRSGARAAMAADVLQQMGFSNVVNLNGGMMAWTKAGKPVVQPEDAMLQLKQPCITE